MIHVITGGYGSGKTETAINLALAFNSRGAKTAIADLDIVNPYFRANDAREKLSRMGVKVVAPDSANTNADVPSLPAEIASMFISYDEAVFDVGGDDQGAYALGRYHDSFAKNEYNMYFCVNPYRPGCSDVQEIDETIRAIEHSSRLKITHLINNANLKRDTTAETVTRGIAFAQQASDKLSLPLAFTAVTREFLPLLPEGMPALELNLHLLLPWE